MNNTHLGAENKIRVPFLFRPVFFEQAKKMGQFDQSIFQIFGRMAIRPYNQSTSLL